MWCSNANSAKGDSICGLQNTSLASMTDSNISIKVAAFVKVKDTDKDNCKKIIKILGDAQKGNNKFEEYVKNITVEAKFKTDIKIKMSDFR